MVIKRELPSFHAISHAPPSPETVRRWDHPQNGVNASFNEEGNPWDQGAWVEGLWIGSKDGFWPPRW